MTLPFLLWLFLSGPSLLWDDTDYSQEFPLPALRRASTLAELDGPVNYVFFTNRSNLFSCFCWLLNLQEEIASTPRPSRSVQFAGHDLDHLSACSRTTASFFEAIVPRTTDIRWKCMALAAECRRLDRLYSLLRVGFDPAYTMGRRRYSLQEAFDILGEEAWYAGRLPQPPTPF